MRSSEGTAQLRWLLLHPEVRGHGIGRRLVEEALNFCRDAGYSSVFLWTVDTLPIAAKLYQSVGFKPIEELTHELWGSMKGKSFLYSTSMISKRDLSLRGAV